MKLYSQEALFAGGVYTVLSYPPAYFQNPIAESFSFLLTGVFVILLFFLFFNKVPSVISHAFRQYPVLSYYLVSFGWVPYFMIAGIVFLPPAATVYEWSDEYQFRYFSDYLGRNDRQRQIPQTERRRPKAGLLSKGAGRS